MDFDRLTALRRHHPAWRLLQADNAPFVASFLHRAFIAENKRVLPRDELALKLEDYLFQLRERLGEDAFPRGAAAYLDDWAGDDKGWLRKFYPPGEDEASYDLTPAMETALAWLENLVRRRFVGTESRLLTVFHLLRQIVDGTRLDPAARIADLVRRKTELEAELARARAGEIPVMDDAQVRDRFSQLRDVAYGLLGDFRALEQSFRELDRASRERSPPGTAGAGCCWTKSWAIGTPSTNRIRAAVSAHFGIS